MNPQTQSISQPNIEPQENQINPSSISAPPERKNTLILITSIITLTLILLSSAVYVSYKFASLSKSIISTNSAKNYINNLNPTLTPRSIPTLTPRPIPTSTPTPINQPVNPEVSYFNTLRLQLSIPTKDRTQNYYLNSNNGDILDPNITDNYLHPAGKIINYQQGNKLNNHIDLGTLFNDHYYVGFADSQNFYIGYISPIEARAAVVPDSIFHNQNWSVGSLGLQRLISSPDKKWFASLITSGGACSSDTGCTGSTTLLIFKTDLTGFQSPYWEDLKNKLPQIKFVQSTSDITLNGLGPQLTIIQWANNGKSIYVSWNLGGLGPPPTVGLGKVGLDGTFVDTGLSTRLTPLVVSNDEHYVIAARSFFGLSNPMLYDLQQQKLVVNLPYDSLITTLRQKYGPDPGDHEYSGEYLKDVSFSPDSSTIFYSIGLIVGPAGSDTTKLIQYKVDVNNPTVATEL